MCRDVEELLQKKRKLVETFIRLLKEKKSLPKLLEKPFRKGAILLSNEDLQRRIRNLENDVKCILDKRKE